jgi:hypothetical protein
MYERESEAKSEVGIDEVAEAETGNKDDHEEENDVGSRKGLHS